MKTLEAGQAFPTMTAERLGGGQVTLGTPSDGFDWQMVVVISWITW